MSDRLSRIEARVGEIDRALVDIQRRLFVLEAPESTAAFATGHVVSLDNPATASHRTEFSSVVSLVGRTFVVLGGAFLLRALTEAGRLPGRGGIALGLLYAVAWFGVADRASVARPLSGLFHGLAAIAISLPLLWEASTHFKLFSPQLSAAILAAITAVALAVAWHRKLQSLAGVTVIGSIAVALALMVATTTPVPFAAGVLALGASTMWLSDARGWTWLRWPPAFAADAVAVGLLARADAAQPVASHRGAMVLLVTLFAAYIVPVCWHALAQDRRLQPSEMFQTACAVALGLFGALFVAGGESRFARPMLSGVSLAAAAAAYVAAFGILRPRTEWRVNVVFFSTLGLAMLLIGGAAIVTGDARFAWCGALALAAAAIGARTSEPQLSLHATVFCVAMASVSGAVAWASDAWFAAGPWHAPGVAYLITGVVVALCLILPSWWSPGSLVSLSKLGTMACVIESALVLVGAGAMVIWLVAPVTVGTPIDPGALATFRTGVLAFSGLAAAALSRVPVGLPFAWLVYPVLAAGGVKLFTDDFRHSAAATLFAALAMYGVTLILAPRLARGVRS